MWLDGGAHSKCGWVGDHTPNVVGWGSSLQIWLGRGSHSKYGWVGELTPNVAG